MNITLKIIEVDDAKGDIKRCKCGKCDNKIVMALFEKAPYDHYPDKMVWIPKIKDLEALQQIINAIVEHNRKHDFNCYKAEAPTCAT